MSVPSAGLNWPSEVDEEGFMISQRNSLFCKVCCCQPNLQWDIRKHKKPPVHTSELFVGETIMTVMEEAGFCGRCWSFVSLFITINKF